MRDDLRNLSISNACLADARELLIGDAAAAFDECPRELEGGFDPPIGGTALATRHELDLWWLLLIAGVIEVLFGFWASGAPVRSAWLLLLWVGIGALIRGGTQLVLAFQVRKIHEAVS